MDWRLELVVVPVSDVDRPKAFYTEQSGFHADHDHTVSDKMRFVQLTPPGSGCSIALGKGLTDTARVAQGRATRRRRYRGRSQSATRPRRPCGRRPGLPVGPLRLLQRPRRQPLVSPADPPAAVNRPGLLYVTHPPPALRPP